MSWASASGYAFEGRYCHHHHHPGTSGALPHAGKPAEAGDHRVRYSTAPALSSQLPHSRQACLSVPSLGLCPDANQGPGVAHTPAAMRAPPGPGPHTRARLRPGPRPMAAGLPISNLLAVSQRQPASSHSSGHCNHAGCSICSQCHPRPRTPELGPSGRLPIDCLEGLEPTEPICPARVLSWGLPSPAHSQGSSLDADLCQAHRCRVMVRASAALCPGSSQTALHH